MKLHEAIRNIVTQFGPDTITQPKRFVNLLADYHAFGDRATRNVLATIMRFGYGEKFRQLCNSPESERLNKMQNYSDEIRKLGFDETRVLQVITSLEIGLGWIEPPAEPDEITEESCPPPSAPATAPANIRTVTVGGVSFSMVWIRGGSFDMGATPEQGIYAAFDEKPPVQVTVSDFYLADTPVTQALWQAVMGNNPSHFSGDELPVERVSWNDCQQFIKRLNSLTGYRFRLPTEAEWEYAARGGHHSRHTKYAGADDDSLASCVWCSANSDRQSHEVKSLSPNELGLYDMSGNIAEWCHDWYFNSYANSGSRYNPTGPATGMARVYRGGSWGTDARSCRVSKRASMSPIQRNKLVGLRLAATQF